MNVETFFSENPCEAWHSTANPGTARWSHDVSFWRYEVQPHIVDWMRPVIRNRTRVLEIGCGIGTDALLFSKWGAAVTAIDFSAESIRLARTRPVYSLIPDFRNWPSAETSLPDGKFDVIYAFGSLHHMEHPERCLALCREHIKATGELRIMVYARFSLKFIKGEQAEAAAGCPIVRLYTYGSIRKLLREAGFGVTEIHKAHIFPYDVEEYRKGNFVEKRWWRMLTPGARASMERYLGHHLLVSARPV